MTTSQHLAAALAVPDGPPDSRSVRVLLVEPHAAMRRTLRALLEDAGIEVAAETATLAGLAAQIRDCRPHVVVADLSARSGANLRSLRWLKASFPHVAIVVTTIQDTSPFERPARDAGASSLVRKDLADPELVRAIRAAL